MIFVDANVIMYAVGRDHPHRAEARAFFEQQAATKGRLVTSAEVLQELLHAYIPVERHDKLDAARQLVEAQIPTVWAVEPADVLLARQLVADHPALRSRDLVHLACCRRRGVERVKTFDRGLAAALSA
jgi:hypothetical protein